jgi:hypothetical protein
VQHCWACQPVAAAYPLLHAAAALHPCGVPPSLPATGQLLLQQHWGLLLLLLLLLLVLLAALLAYACHVTACRLYQQHHAPPGCPCCYHLPQHHPQVLASFCLLSCLFLLWPDLYLLLHLQ